MRPTYTAAPERAAAAQAEAGHSPSVYRVHWCTTTKQTCCAAECGPCPEAFLAAEYRMCIIFLAVFGTGMIFFTARVDGVWDFKVGHDGNISQCTPTQSSPPPSDSSVSQRTYTHSTPPLGQGKGR
jgi:hypothetical protein